MNVELKYILKTIFTFLGGCAIICATSFCFIYEVFNFNGAPAEGYITEFLQLVLLLLCVGSFLVAGLYNKSSFPAMLLIAGFFFCMFIRELDYLFDRTPVSWFALVLATACGCFFYATKHWRQAVSSLADFCASHSFVALACGLAAVLVFSRLMGMKIIWKALMQEHYLWAVKATVEEAIELFGYTLCAMGAVDYAVQTVRFPLEIKMPLPQSASPMLALPPEAEPAKASQVQ